MAADENADSPCPCYPTALNQNPKNCTEEMLTYAYENLSKKNVS